MRRILTATLTALTLTAALGACSDGGATDARFGDPAADDRARAAKAAALAEPEPEPAPAVSQPVQLTPADTMNPIYRALTVDNCRNAGDPGSIAEARTFARDVAAALFTPPFAETRYTYAQFVDACMEGLGY